MGLGPSIVSLFLAVSRRFSPFLAVSRHVKRTYSEKALEMMGLGPSIVSLFLAVSRHVKRTYSKKALEMMGQGPSYGFFVAPSRCAHATGRGSCEIGVGATHLRSAKPVAAGAGEKED
jgi:hypothetical protein